MIRFLRQLIGSVIALAGVVLPAWGIFHLIRQPACGDTAPACPDEVGLWIFALVGGFTLLIPLGVLLAGREAPIGRVLLLRPVMWLAPLAFMSGIVVSLVGGSSDPDTRWIGYLLGGIAALVAIRALLGALRHWGDPPSVVSVASPAGTVSSAAQMQSLASALEHVKAAKGIPADGDLAARLKRLDELHASGLVDDAEHRRRRDEILAEI